MPSFSMAVGNVELMQECSPEHLHTRTASLNYDKETEEGGKNKFDYLCRPFLLFNIYFQTSFECYIRIATDITIFDQ